MLTFIKFAVVLIGILNVTKYSCRALYEGSACKMKDNRPGICTILTQCKSIDDLLRKRQFEFKNLIICSFVGKMEVICCPDNVGITTATTDTLLINSTTSAISQTPIKTFSASPSVRTPGSTNSEPALSATERTRENAVTVGNIRITKETQFIDLTKLIQHSSRKASNPINRKTEPSPFDPNGIFTKTTRRPSAKVRDLKDVDTTTRWPVTPSKSYSPVFMVGSGYGRVLFPDSEENRREQWHQNEIFFDSTTKSPPVWQQTFPTHRDHTTRTQPTESINWPTPTISTSTPRTSVTPSTPAISSSVLDQWMIDVLQQTSGSSTTTRTPSLPSSSSTTSSTPFTTFWGSSSSFDDNNEVTRFPNSRLPSVQPSPPSSRASERKSDKVCSEYKAAFAKLPKIVDFHILGGEPTTRGEFPHMAAIGYPAETLGQSSISFECGGSLISDRYIVTAAHCVNRPDRWPNLIRLGTINVSDTSDGAQDAGVENILLHPEYRTALQYHDIALVRLNISVELSQFIFPACLHTDRADPTTRIPLVATGWGVTSVDTRERSDLLLKINLTIVELRECNTSILNYAKLRRLPNGLNDGQLCAFDPELKRDTCQADSGGPLQEVEAKGLSRIVGLTSFGVSCGSSIPSVYARVASYLDWIETNVWPGSI